jgi:hypothetical protein
MAPVDLQTEIQAVTSYLRLLESAQECRRLYERASIPLPEPLLRLLGGQSDSSHKQMSLKLSSPEVDTSRNATKPPEAGEDWISIRVGDVSPTTVTVAILRAAREPMRAKEVSDRVSELLPMAAGGSIYNLLNRLRDDGAVEHDSRGWYLRDKDVAGILAGGYLWAPKERLAKTDLAAHRREAIVYILRNERYLQVMELVRKLLDWDWVKAPVNKDLLKGDMAILEQEGKVQRIENTRNWEVVAE